MKKVMFLLLIGLTTFVLVSCSGNHAETAVQYLNAINNRDLETAQSLVCESRKDDVTMGLMSVTEQEEDSFSFINISCSDRGDDALCRFTIKQETQSTEVTGVERPHEVIFNFDGDKVCGFEEQVAN